MIPRDKPKEIVCDVEWVAMHTDFYFPEVTDARFLAAFKKVMIEVAGDRLYDYRAAEQVDQYLVSGGLSCPSMEKAAAAEGFTKYSKIKDFIRLQMDVLQGAAEKWKGHDPMHLEMWPAWMLVRTGVCEESDWREQWQKAGGKVFQPLIEGRNPDYEESGLIALKIDTIWQRLGNPEIFPGALGIDHPPFYSGSWLSWKPVEKIEAIALGLIPSDRTMDVTVRLIAMHIDKKKGYADILDRSIQERDEARSAREAEDYKERTDWWGIVSFSVAAGDEVKKAVRNGVDLTALDKRLRDALQGSRIKDNPKVAAALRRALANLMEARGRATEALDLYGMALELNPKVGCKRDYERLRKKLGRD